VDYVSISDADRHPSLDYCATVYHGIPIEEYPFTGNPGSYLLFFGRIHPDKGTFEAIRLAQEAGLPLIIAGIIQDREYFDRFVAPYLDGDKIKYIGSVGPSKKGDLLGGALALIHLINFNEPFGISVIEAMACGTPVIAANRGSMPELIRHGGNGFLVERPEEALNCLQRVGKLSRRGCRDWVEAYFTVEVMVRRYMEVYTKIREK
ncbi:MAG TPA: glycosyltransferase family 4 protein, partial [Firmicutes bacterium]|nr:glycosyltransferase family 4 protein [Bacillota bacterium]